MLLVLCMFVEGLMKCCRVLVCRISRTSLCSWFSVRFVDPTVFLFVCCFVVVVVCFLIVRVGLWSSVSAL